MSDWARTAAINALCDQENPDDTAPIESALRQARADALEEAAAMCKPIEPDAWSVGERTLGLLLAERIRNLKDKQP